MFNRQFTFGVSSASTDQQLNLQNDHPTSFGGLFSKDYQMKVDSKPNDNKDL